MGGDCVLGMELFAGVMKHHFLSGPAVVFPAGSCMWHGGFSPPQGAARNPEDMDRERREHEREERMGQLRGSATRALPPGPPAGATANRLRNVTEPMASTPTSRIQQSGEWGGKAGE